MAAIRNTLEEFIEDIEPFFYGKRINYVDVGAFTGEVFKKLLASNLKILESHLIEPNPSSFEKLQESIKSMESINPIIKGESLHFYNVAAGASKGKLELQAAASMTKVISDGIKSNPSEINKMNTFLIPSITLDELVDLVTEQHISLLKIDVEGFELQVLKGASKILDNQQVDIIYIEAGMNPDGTQQCYYRDIDDIMLGFKYRLFKIYEQQFEWIVDSPFLRRVNLAYMSERFAANNPYRLSRELYELKKQLKAAKTELIVLQSELAKNAQERDDLAERLAALEQADQTLNHQLAEARTQQHATAQERDDLAEQLAALEQAHQTLNHQLAEARTQQHATAQERDGLATSLSKMKSYQSTSEGMAREVFKSFDDLQRCELRARNEANLLRNKLDRIQRQHAYRVGQAIVSNLRGPKGWIKIPGAVIEANKASRLDQTNFITSKKIETAYHIFSGPIAHLSLTSSWQSLSIPTVDIEKEIWITALTVKPKESIELETKLYPQNVFEIPPETEESLTSAPLQRLTIEMEKPLFLMLLSPNNNFIELKFRKIMGPLCILKFELRTGRNDRNLQPVLPVQNIENRLLEIGENRKGFTASPDKLTQTEKINTHKLVSRKNILWHAQEMIREGRVDEGISFAKKNPFDHERLAVNLLLANQAIHDDDTWLRYLNNYVTQFNISPIELLPLGSSRFLRLSAKVNHAVEHGPLVSVIMPAFNAEKTVEFAAKSILNQTWRPIELIIIDDSSEDETCSIIQSLAQLDDRVKVLRNQVNVGPYVSKNLALKVAKGIYITGHDADDWAHPERIERQVTAMLAADHPIKASLTRMIRLTELGIFSHFKKIGPVSDDGALRDASISGMFDAQFFKKQLGYWDSVRFGADSELIARARLILGEGFVKFRQLGMLCLDAENSLTNHPIHGVSKIHGISETRQFYRDQWTQWHTIITPDTAYIPFPQYKRFFDAPDVALVPTHSIEIVCGNHFSHPMHLLMHESYKPHAQT